MRNQIVQWFEKEEQLKMVSGWFAELAYKVEAMIPDGPEKSTALRKVLEGRDAAIRAASTPLDEAVEVVQQVRPIINNFPTITITEEGF